MQTHLCLCDICQYHIIFATACFIRMEYAEIDIFFKFEEEEFEIQLLVL